MHGNFYRKSDTWSNIAISILILLISNPYNIKNTGVLLSYGGTIGIVYFLNLFRKKEKSNLLVANNIKTKLYSYIKDNFLISIYAQTMIMPIMAYTYKTISFTFFITNILTSYLIGLIIIFGFVLIIVSIIHIEIAKLFGVIYKLLIDLLLIIAKYTSQIPFSKIYVKTPKIWQIILYYIIIFLIGYLYKKFRKKMDKNTGKNNNPEKQKNSFYNLNNN